MTLQPSLFDVPPVSGLTRSSRAASSGFQTRWKGLEAAAIRRTNLWGRMLAIYAEGPQTDAEMALRLNVDRTTINGRRKELMQLGKVRDMGETRINPKSRKPNTLWGLT